MAQRHIPAGCRSALGPAWVAHRRGRPERTRPRRLRTGDARGSSHAACTGREYDVVRMLA
ncbi:Hypothetical protein I596_2488 [Dokdonella koreensis DS-123]|uniref:Uncharacterized protein n=1 Tax=Dokdonella koreensis DS-123 TaxID=1300342 RepID=A0A160DX26_9GAMM|nr:Hypothetical protein I596_2488 [Dokdonella koreensis DS-123]